ncbi:MAG: 3-deoxy-manno-octulosonate cytidylyltransferase [Luteibaculaceae bacterium]
MLNKSRVVGIIPARFGSTRFPGKPLVDIGGKTMIQRVFEQAKRCEGLSKVVVATDDIKIKEEVLRFGGDVVLTGSHHESGTDRCLEALEKIGGTYDAVINIQGDEPFLNPLHIDALIEGLAEFNLSSIVTLCCKLQTLEKAVSPHVVKIALSNKNTALYFSRALIPFNKTAAQEDWLAQYPYVQHIGVYAYPVEILRKICSLSVGNLEKIEGLEQLRWLENGFSIAVKEVDKPGHAIDTPQDLEEVKILYKKG